MKTFRVIPLVVSVTINLLIVGILIFWVVPVARIAALI
jgi:hypothetical protein